MTYLLALIASAAVVGLWFDGLRAREQVLRVCANACREAGVQLLDHTVALAAWRLRPWRGRIVIQRLYTFEFSSSGTDRWRGWVSLYGREVMTVNLAQPARDSQAGDTEPEHDPFSRRL